MSERYVEVCRMLGINPDVQFVKLLRGGSVCFTIGKPEEIRSLLKRVREVGLRPSRKLVRVASR